MRPTLYELPKETHANSMTTGPDGAIWFTEFTSLIGNPPKIGRVGPGGEVTIFPLSPSYYLGEIVVGPDNNLWFSESDSGEDLVPRIGRITPSGEVVEWKLEGDHSLPPALTVGPDGAVWFAYTYSLPGDKLRSGMGRAAIGRIDASGVARLYRLPPRSDPADIATGSDGNLWFTDPGSRPPVIGRISPAGELARFPISRPGRVPTLIVAGREGNLWFGTEVPPPPLKASYGERLGRVTTSGEIKEFRVHGGGYTAGLAPRPQGGVWYSSQMKSGALGIGAVGRRGRSGPLLCVGASPCGTDADELTVGSDGSLWFGASTYVPSGGGGLTGLNLAMGEEREAGLVGHFPLGSIR